MKRSTKSIAFLDRFIKRWTTEGLNYEELKAEATEMYKASHVWDFAKNDYCPYYCSRCGAKGGAKMKGGAE